MVTVTGGDKLEAALKEIAAKLSKASTLKVGFKAGSTNRAGESIPMIAAIDEYGAPSRGQPPRPFFRNMIASKSPEWPAGIAQALKDNDFDAAKALKAVGLAIEHQLQDSIRDTNSPPLSPVTIMMRGMRTQARYQNMKFGDLITEARARVAAGKTNYGASSKPLIDHGDMYASVTSFTE